MDFNQNGLKFKTQTTKFLFLILKLTQTICFLQKRIKSSVLCIMILLSLFFFFVEIKTLHELCLYIHMIESSYYSFLLFSDELVKNILKHIREIELWGIFVEYEITRDLHSIETYHNVIYSKGKLRLGTGRWWTTICPQDITRLISLVFCPKGWSRFRKFCWLKQN